MTPILPILYSVPNLSLSTISSGKRETVIVDPSLIILMVSSFSGFSITKLLSSLKEEMSCPFIDITSSPFLRPKL